MLCLFLVIKAIEILASSAFRDTENRLNGGALEAACLAVVGAIVFGIWIYVHGTNAAGNARLFGAPVAGHPDPHVDDCLDSNGNSVPCNQVPASQGGTMPD